MLQLGQVEIPIEPHFDLGLVAEIALLLGVGAAGLGVVTGAQEPVRRFAVVIVCAVALATAVVAWLTSHPGQFFALIGLAVMGLTIAAMALAAALRRPRPSDDLLNAFLSGGALSVKLANQDQYQSVAGVRFDAQKRLQVQVGGHWVPTTDIIAFRFPGALGSADPDD